MNRGINTPDDLLGRCRVDELLGCWNWTGAATDGNPRIWAFDPKAAVKMALPGARAAWYIGGGAPIARGRVAYMRCCNRECVRPEHSKVGTKADAGACLAASGHLRGDPIRRLRNVENAMRKSKVTPDMLAEIRGCDESGVKLGKRLGIAHSTVSAIRTGIRHRAPQASIFGWKP